MIRRLRLPLMILAVLAIAAGAGLKFTGKLGGEAPPAPKVAGPVVSFAEPFTVNLADPGGTAYASVKLAVQLAPMTEADKHLFDTGGQSGGHGAPTESVGAGKVSGDAALKDAIVRALTRYPSAQLLRPEGKEHLKKQMLRNFAEVAAHHEVPKGLEHPHMPSDPPYHIENVYLENFTIQPPV